MLLSLKYIAKWLVLKPRHLNSSAGLSADEQCLYPNSRTKSNCINWWCTGSNFSCDMRAVLQLLLLSFCHVQWGERKSYGTYWSRDWDCWLKCKCGFPDKGSRWEGTVSIYTVCKVLIQWMKWATLLTVEFCWSMFLSKRDPAAQGLCVSLLQLCQQNIGVQAQETSCYRQL